GDREELDLAALPDSQLTHAERGHERRVVGQDPELALAAGDRHGIDLARVGEALRRDDLEMEGHQDSSLAAFSRTSSMVPARKKACSGRVSVLPSRISLNDATVSLTGTYLPALPVKTSPTKNGWLMKRWRRRARATVALSSSDSSSIPRIAMMSCRSR